MGGDKQTKVKSKSGGSFANVGWLRTSWEDRYKSILITWHPSRTFILRVFFFYFFLFLGRFTCDVACGWRTSPPSPPSPPSSPSSLSSSSASRSTSGAPESGRPCSVCAAGCFVGWPPRPPWPTGRAACAQKKPQQHAFSILLSSCSSSSLFFFFLSFICSFFFFFFSFFFLRSWSNLIRFSVCQTESIGISEGPKQFPSVATRKRASATDTLKQLTDFSEPTARGLWLDHWRPNVDR